MPKIVDHDKRREEIIDTAWRVIAREGLSRTTTRKIAEECGFANGLLAHYFKDKQAILDSALTLAVERASVRIQGVADKYSGFDLLRETLLVGLPLDEERRLGVEVMINFWGRQLGMPDRTQRQYQSYVGWSRLVRRLVSDSISSGEVRAGIDVDIVTDMLVGLVDGIATEAALYPDRFPPDRQIAVVDVALASIRAADLNRESATLKGRDHSSAPL